MDSARVLLIPGVLAISSTLARDNSCSPPKYFSSSRRRLGPTPAIPSRTEVRRVLPRRAR